jgi:hypothetical protein
MPAVSQQFPVRLTQAQRKVVTEIVPELADRLKKAKAATARGAKPYRPRKKSCGGFFWKTLLAKDSAWTWRQQNRELMILEMSCQVVFRQCVFQKPGSPLRKADAVKRKQGRLGMREGWR